MPPRLERAQNIVDGVKEEIERFKAGEINNVSSLKELNERFGYSEKSHSTFDSLQKAGLLKERRDIFRLNKEKSKIEIPPSRELAWMLGVLAGGGYVNPKEKGISIDSINKDFLNAFGSLGEKVFLKKATSRKKKSQELKGVTFYSQATVRFLGDLRRPEWPNTIIEKHAWILKDQKYAWGFLEGLFERVGNVYISGKNRKRYKSVFYTSYINIANFYSDLLSLVGVKKTSLDTNKNKITGIKIENKSDIQFLAKNIRSAIKQKEDKLDFYRKLPLPFQKENFKEKRKKQTEENSPPKIEMVILEWLNLKELLGHNPREADVKEMFKKGETKYNADDYKKIFLGKKEGKFSDVTKNIEKLIYAIAKERIDRNIRMIDKASKSDQAQDMVEFAREEIKKLKNGEIKKTSSDAELALKFRYASKSAIYNILKKADLSADRKWAKMETAKNMLTPSVELAWIVGLLASGGSVGLEGSNAGVITLSSQNDSLRRAFKLVGENLFRSKISDSAYKNNKQDAKKYYRAIFNNIDAARTLGDLRRIRWPKTISERHDWILNDKKYIWSFLRGFFDTSGNIGIKDNPEVTFYVSKREEADFLIELLREVGFNNPRVISSKTAKERIQGIRIRGLKDIKNFAENLHSEIPEKETRLELNRSREFKKRGRPKNFLKENQYSRPRRLINYVEAELQKYKHGEISRLSTSRDLAKQFKYKRSGKVVDILRKKIPNVYRERKSILKPQRKEFKTPDPSKDLAWVMGALCGAGHSDPRDLKTSQVILTGVESSFVNKCRLLAEDLFETNLSNRIQISKKKNARPNNVLVFNRRGIVEFFGHISRETWPETLKQHHSWITSRQEYIKEFISGFFDARGVVELPRKKSKSGGQLRIITSYKNVAFFLAELLAKLGIERITLAKKNINQDRLSGVSINSYKDIKNFSKMIYSSIAEKEKRLSFYRDDEFKPVTRDIPFNEDEIVEDYLLARMIVVKEKGRLPSQGDFRRLHTEGIIKFTDKVCANHFGDGSFFKGRSKMEEILRERQRELYQEILPPSPGDYSDEALIKEYLRLRSKILEERGRLPHSSDIVKLKKSKSTIYGRDVYAFHFGGGKNSFKVASENLERIISEQEANKSQVSDSRPQETQVFP